MARSPDFHPQHGIQPGLKFRTSAWSLLPNHRHAEVGPLFVFVFFFSPKQYEGVLCNWCQQQAAFKNCSNQLHYQHSVNAVLVWFSFII